jgi:aspartyl protease family protein
MADGDGPWSFPPPPKPERKRLRRALWIGLVAILALGLVALLALFPDRMRGPEDWTFLARGLLVLVVVAAGAASVRRLKLRQTALHVLIWALVGAALVLGVTYKDELAQVGQRVRSALVPAYAVATAAHQMTLTQDQDGDYHVIGQVNGQPVSFLVDTGASEVVLSPADAQRLGVDVKTLKFDRAFETANGIGLGARFQAASLAIGAIRLANVPVSINQTPMATSLLGMSFLRRLDSFEFKGGQLILTWRS